MYNNAYQLIMYISGSTRPAYVIDGAIRYLRYFSHFWLLIIFRL